MVVTGGGTAEHDKAWISGHLPADGSVTITDESTKWC